MRRTKIIATLGPAVKDEEKMRELIRSGCDIARLNAAHGTIEEHRNMLRNFVNASQELNRVTATLLDIKGPEIRTTTCRKNFIKNGESVTIGPGGDIEVNHSVVYEHLQPGARVLLHDGDIVLEIEKSGEISKARVIRGGIISSKMGVNIPGVHIPIPYIQERDLKFMEALRDVDFIAASFTRNANDILQLKRAMKKLNVNAGIIAKIENQEGVDNIGEILEISDGIMVARGDLGTEIPLENLPHVQKYLLSKAIEHGKPGIIATQILESMIRSPHPTRAEVSDIANAILDGADALMLSGETAIGKYPMEAVSTLAKVAESADLLVEKKEFIDLRGTISESVSNAAVLLAMEIKANAILVLTRSGKTARLISRHRSSIPVIAATHSSKVLRDMSIYWGIRGFKIERFRYADEAVKKAIEEAEKEELVRRGDVLVIVGGEPSEIPGTTNFVWVQLVGDVIARGIGFGERVVRGKACRKPNRCDIIIVDELTDDFDGTGIKGIIIESNIFQVDSVRKLAEKGLSIVAGTGKIEINREKINLDPKRGIVWK